MTYVHLLQSIPCSQERSFGLTADLETPDLPGQLAHP